MSIVSLTDILSFLDISVGYFTVDASHDILVLTYGSTGTATNVEVDDGTYNGTDLATELQTEARADLSSTGMTVAYSTTTKKFTITAATTGETIALTHTGSDAALLFGFNQDHDATYEIESDLVAGDPSEIVSVIHDSVEDWVEAHCHRKFEATLYVKERHDGDEQDIIYFDQYPVIAVNLDGLVWSSTGKTVTRNDGGSFVTDGFTTGAKVLVQGSDDNSGLLTLDVDGVAATGLTFTDTITADTDDDNVILSHFRELWVNDTEIDEDDYGVHKDHIYYRYGLSEGHGNVRMTYYAGYSSTTMPKNLQLAVKIITKAIYQKRKEEVFGVKNYKVGDVSIACEDSDIPREAMAILSSFKRHLI